MVFRIGSTMGRMAIWAFPVAFLCVLTACMTGYEAATVTPQAISNPSVGWNGYSIKIPARYHVFDPAKTDFSSSSGKDAYRRAFLKDERLYASDMAVAFHERFLLEFEKDESFIVFSPSTWEFPAPLSTSTSMEKEYLLRKFVNYRLVEINDTDAFHEFVTINGHRAYHIRGFYSPYSAKNAVPTYFEEYFILGDLKDVYQIMGLSLETDGNAMQKTLREMVESLEI